MRPQASSGRDPRSGTRPACLRGQFPRAHGARRDTSASRVRSRLGPAASAYTRASTVAAAPAIRRRHTGCSRLARRPNPSRARTCTQRASTPAKHEGTRAQNGAPTPTARTRTTTPARAGVRNHQMSASRSNASRASSSRTGGNMSKLNAPPSSVRHNDFSWSISA